MTKTLFPRPALEPQNRLLNLKHKERAAQVEVEATGNHMTHPTGSVGTVDWLLWTIWSGGISVIKHCRGGRTVCLSGCWPNSHWQRTSF